MAIRRAKYFNHEVCITLCFWYLNERVLDEKDSSGDEKFRFTKSIGHVCTQKNVWLNQPNFGWFNHRIWLLYGQPNFWLSEQNSLVNKIRLIIPIILVDPTKYYG